MIPFLDREHALDKTLHQNPRSYPSRCARVQAYVDKKFCEFKANLGDRDVVAEEVFHNRHAHIDSNLMRKVELACLADPRVQEKIAQLKLPKEVTVVVEPWTYGTDGMNDMSKLMTMVCCLVGYVLFCGEC